MKKRLGVGETMAASVVGFAFLLAGMFLMLLGLTFIPVLGVVGAIPFMAIALSFFRIKPPKAEHDEGIEAGVRKAGLRMLAPSACSRSGLTVRH